MDNGMSNRKKIGEKESIRSRVAIWRQEVRPDGCTLYTEEGPGKYYTEEELEEYFCSRMEEQCRCCGLRDFVDEIFDLCLEDGLGGE